jgi:hypothetical protein
MDGVVAIHPLMTNSPERIAGKTRCMEYTVDCIITRKHDTKNTTSIT